MVGVFLMFRRERERINVGENRGTKLSFSPIFCASRGRRKAIVPFKTTSFWAFFLTVYGTTPFWTKRAVSFKWKGVKICLSSHCSSICDLFNRVLNCNFNCKNQFNYIPTKNQTAALELAALFTLVLGLEFMQFDPQLSNKLLISSF